MQRPLALVGAALLLVGCQSQTPKLDPFLGRTTVPAPGTGQAAAPVVGQPYYYQGSPNQAAPYQPAPYQGTPGQEVPPLGAPPIGTAPPAGPYNGSHDRSRSAPPSEQAMVAQSPDARQDNRVTLASATDDSIASRVRRAVMGREPAIRVPDDAQPLRSPPQSARGVPFPVANQRTATGVNARTARPLFAPSAPALVAPPSFDARVAQSRQPPQSRPQAVRQPTQDLGYETRPRAQNPRYAVRPPARSPAPRVARPPQRPPSLASQPTRRGAPYAVRPRAPQAATRQPAGVPRHFNAPPNPIKIASLPNRPPVQPQPAAAAPTRASSPQPTEAVATARQQPVTLATNVKQGPTQPSKPVTRYGYEQDYRRLQGKLEYSASRREWKLRYIPIDGDTDQYGGSVAIGNAESLDDFKPGDFVSVEGGVVQEAESGSFAPTYSIARVTPQPN